MAKKLSSKFDKELKIAVAAVKKSEKTFRKYFGTKIKTKIKEGDYRNLVSYADTKIESDIIKFVSRHFPHHAFHAEESGASGKNSKFLWVLDPIDGTNNYLQGVPECGIALGLLKNGQPVVSVVYFPMLNKLYTATSGSRSKVNGKPIRVSKIKDVKYAFGSLGWGRNLNFAKKTFPKLVSKILKIRVPASRMVSLCYVAEGVYDFHVDIDMGLWEWDTGRLIIQQAGGKCILVNKRIGISANSVLLSKIKKLF